MSVLRDCEIKLDDRSITIGNGAYTVQWNTSVDGIQFLLPCGIDDYFDSETKQYTVIYNAPGSTEELTKSVTVSGTDGVFYYIPWEFDLSVTATAGAVVFGLCVEALDGDTVVEDWNTAKARFTVIKTMDHSNLVPAPDIEITGTVQTAIENAVSSYMDDNTSIPTSGAVDEDSSEIVFYNSHGTELFRVDLSMIGEVVRPEYADIQTSETAMTINEDSTGTLGVNIARKLAGSQTVTITSDNANVTVSPSTLTFTGDTAKTQQSVTITVADDDSEESYTANLTLSSSNVASVTVALTIRDNDVIDYSIVPDYWESTVSEIESYVTTMGSGWIHDIVLTDTHYGLNNRRSIAVCNALMDSGKFSKLLLLGDVTETCNPDSWQLMLDDGLATHKDDILFAIGNHDTSTSLGMSLTDYYDALLSSRNDLVFYDNTATDSALYNYYYDDTENNIRYIVVAFTATNAVMSWAYSRYSDAPSGYITIFLCHYPTINTDDYTDSKAGNMGLLRSQIVIADKPFYGWWCGHIHEFSIDQIDSFGMYQATFINDRIMFQNDSTGDKKLATNARTEGTITEQSITIVSVNPSTGVVRSKIYGATPASYYEDSYTVTETPETWYSGYCLADGGIGTSTGSHYYTKPLDVSDDAVYYIYTESYYDLQPCTKYFVQFYTDTTLESYIGRFAPVLGNGALYNAVWAKARGYITKISRTVHSKFASATTAILSTDADNGNYTDLIISTTCPEPTTAFDASYIGSGYIANSDGGSRSSTNGYYHEYLVSVEPSTSYTLSNSNANFTMTWAGIGMYSTFYGDHIRRVAGSVSGNSYTFTTDASAKYVFITWESSSADYNSTMTFTQNT